MTGTAASVYAKVVTTLGSRLRSRAMVTIAALLGVAGLVTWPVAALPVAEADQGSGTLPRVSPVADGGTHHETSL